MNLVVVMQSFNRISLLEKALNSLIPMLEEINGLGLAVYDAGSTDGSIELLERFAGSSTIPIKILKLQKGEDSSFSAGVNKITAFAESEWSSLEWLLLFETDNVILSSTPVKQAVELMRTEQNVGAVGFTVRKHSGESAGWGSDFPTVVSFIAGQQLSAKFGLNNPTVKDWYQGEGFRWTYADVVYTSPLLVRLSAWKETGGLNAEAYPFSDCDLEWAHRLKKLGSFSAVIKSSDVIHDNLEEISNWSLTRVHIFHEARLKLLKDMYGSKVTLVKPLLFTRHLVETMLLVVSVPFRKNASRSVRKRVNLLASVFRDYKLKESK